MRGEGGQGGEGGGGRGEERGDRRYGGGEMGES